MGKVLSATRTTTLPLIALAPNMAACWKRLYAAYEADPAEMIDMGAELGRFLRRLPV